MTEQLSMFDTLKMRIQKPKAPVADYSEWALAYLVTMNGGNCGNLFVLSVDDARKLCEDECSHGQGRGGPWMFQWTSLEHFAKDDAGAAQHKNTHGKLEPFVFIRDTGKQDKDFDRLGIHKPTREDCETMLRSMGYEFRTK